MAIQIQNVAMKAPTSEQSDWARDSRLRVAETYREWTAEGPLDFAPMLALIEHVGKSGHASLLSAGTSLHHLIIAAAADVRSPNNLAEDAPSICITQLAKEFEFRDARGRRRKCLFDRAADLLDVHLIRLSMQADSDTAGTLPLN